MDATFSGRPQFQILSSGLIIARITDQTPVTVDRTFENVISLKTASFVTTDDTAGARTDKLWNPGDISYLPTSRPSGTDFHGPGSMIGIVLPDPPKIGLERGRTDDVRTLLQQDDPVVRHLILAIEQLDADADPLLVDQLTTALSIRVSGWFAGKEDERSEASRRNAIARSIEYIHDNLHQPLRLSEIASAAAMSLHHFSRTFKRQVGLSPYAYVTKSRVKKAQQLIRACFPMSHIAQTCGFRSQSAFSTIFRRLVGTTPTGYKSC